MFSNFQDSASNIQHRPSAFIHAKGSKLLDTSAFLGFTTDHQSPKYVLVGKTKNKKECQLFPFFTNWGAQIKFLGLSLLYSIHDILLKLPGFPKLCQILQGGWESTKEQTAWESRRGNFLQISLKWIRLLCIDVGMIKRALDGAERKVGGFNIDFPNCPGI